MSYIFIDVDAARRCVASMNRGAEKLGALLAAEPGGEMTGKLEAFHKKLAALAGDLSAATEKYAAEDEHLKAVHLATGEGGRVKNG
jgi:hypothetical protein